MIRARMSVKRLMAVGLAATLAFAACGSDDDGEDTADDTTETTAGGGDAEYAIAFVGPETGPYANLGLNIRRGMEVALAEAAEDGLNVELKAFDTQGSPDQANTLKSQFLDDEKIIGVVGPTFSGETKALLKDLTDKGLVMISASATNVDLPNEVPDSPIFHRIIPDDAVQGEGISGYVTKVLKAKTAAYIHDNTDYGKGLSDGTQALLEEAGVTTAKVETIDPNAEDYSTAVNSVKGTNADIIFFGGYYEEAGLLRKQLVDADVDAKFISGDGALDLGFLEASGPQGNGAILTCPCQLATEESEGKLGEFAKLYQETTDNAPGTYSGEGYDAAKILLEGIKGGATDRKALVDYVEALGPYEGLYKTIEFEENGNVKAGNVYVYEIKDGKLELLGTTEELAA